MTVNYKVGKLSFRAKDKQLSRQRLREFFLSFTEAIE